MNVFCTLDFKNELETLLKDKKYKNFEKLIIKFLFSTKVLSAPIINGVNPPIPLLKKRIGGSKGLRMYYYLFKVEDNLYLTYVHPKIGTKGIPNISSTEQQKLLKNLITSIKSNNIFEVTETDNKIYFNN